MPKPWLVICAALWVLFPAKATCESSQKVTVCELQKNPPAYNHKLVEVTAFVSHDFEDFTLFDPTCRDWPAIWLEYGGTAKSDTMYCCGVTAGKSRPHQLSIESIPIPIVEDDRFRQFDREIQPPFLSGKFGSVVHATLVGRFFAGRKVTGPSGYSAWMGFGHMGCCSLLAIQQVESVDPQDRNDLDYGASPDQPNVDKAGCGYNFLTPITPGKEALQELLTAESVPVSPAFSDPERVASDFLTRHLKQVSAASLKLKKIRTGQGRIVYRWTSRGEAPSYMIVVSKPYVFSFYARDPRHVPWAVLAAYRISCDDDNSVQRVR